MFLPQPGHTQEPQPWTNPSYNMSYRNTQRTERPRSVLPGFTPEPGMEQNHSSRNQSFRLGSCLVASIEFPTDACTVHTDTQAWVKNQNLKLSVLKWGRKASYRLFKLLWGQVPLLKTENMLKSKTWASHFRIFSCAWAELCLCTNNSVQRQQQLPHNWWAQE